MALASLCDSVVVLVADEPTAWTGSDPRGRAYGGTDVTRETATGDGVGDATGWG